MENFENKKRIPIGISDFKTLIENDNYYIDKTKIIEDLLVKGTGVTLFTRPRRFGKTLNMSMLRYFFDVKNAEENKKLFKDLYIENSPAFKEQGQYPVIYISLKDFKERTLTSLNNKLKYELASIFEKYLYIYDKLSEFEKDEFKNIMKKISNIDDLAYSLKFLSKLLSNYYNKKVILLIDEYDTPLIAAYEYGYYDEAINFFRTFFSAALKDNEYLQLGVMTGILRVAKEGIFSGLNNLLVQSVLNENYSIYFGLTEKEVEEMLKYYQMEYKIEEVKDWYDGYKFGSTEIYNPWSIINYVYHKELAPYWIGTSDNLLIYNLLGQANQDIFDEFKLLFAGEMIEKSLDPNFSFKNIRNIQEIWQLLVHSGYLKIQEKLGDNFYILKIPNKEIYSSFKKDFINNFLGGVDVFREMINALKQENIKVFERKLQSILASNMSYYDTAREEKYYHNFVLGMVLSMMKDYNISSNLESGYGRYHISIEPKDKSKTAYILEFKLASSEENLEIKCEEALQQIEKNEYDTKLKEKGINKILKLGIAFHKKKVRVMMS